MTRRLLTIAAVLAAYLAASAADYADSQRAATRCFPASVWDARQGDRPCATIRRVWEDGSVRLVVRDADGDRRYAVGIGAQDR
jgi:hypothetical protein